MNDETMVGSLRGSEGSFEHGELLFDSSMDLSNWEYLTSNFDHDDIFGERSLPLEEVFKATEEYPQNGGGGLNKADAVYPTHAQTNINFASNTISNSSASSYFNSQQPHQAHHAATTQLSLADSYAAAVSASEDSGSTLSHADSGHWNSATNEFLESIQARRHELLYTSNNSATMQPTNNTSSSNSGYQHFGAAALRHSPLNASASGRDDNGHLKPRFVAANACQNASVVSTSSSAASAPSAASSRPKLCKPLKVYNYFYRDERDNIINGVQNQGDPLPPPVSNFSQEKYEQLLYQRWFIDPVKERRQHRKMHGKIDFATLSKTVAERWRNLPEAGREFYRQIARADQEHYKSCMLNLSGAEAVGQSSSAPCTLTATKKSKKKKSK